MLIHVESFGVDDLDLDLDLDLNLNEPVDLNVFQIETQSELPVSEELDVGRTQEPIVEEVRTQEPIVEEVRTQEPIMEYVIVEDYVSFGEYTEQGNGQKDESAPSDGQFFYDDEGIYTACDTQYYVHYSKGVGTDYDDDDDDEDDDFMVDEKNEIVEPDVDVHFFSISMDVPFENIGVNNLVSDDVLEEENVDVINANGFDTDLGNDDETRNYKMRRDYGVELQSTNLNTTIKIVVERNTAPSLPTRVFQKIYVWLGALKLGFMAYRRDLLGLDGAFMKGPFPGQVLAAIGLDSNNEIYSLAYVLVETKSKSSWCWFLQCLGDDIDLYFNSNFTFISDRQKDSIMLYLLNS
uniref:MULE transposase domain-containing protein n=1 Tax=Tanacetum cinerariifolium TaxID=118510 RepID=A0A6L2JJ53_TANCI|nr:hypothetical protein [Tanacetum cinerariifolium]